MNRILSGSPLVLVLGVVLCTACGAGSTNTTDIAKNDVQDVGNDLPQADSTPDLPNFEVTDIPTVDIAEYVPEPGEFGAPCTDNVECNSGFCVPTPSGSKCSKQCEDDCPAGWVCAKAATDPDLIYICVPRFVNLCNPCNSNSECAPEGVDSAKLDLCLAKGDEGSFCGADCSTDPNSCPKGYVCDDITTPGGNFKQCVPESGECLCSQLAVQKSAATTCFAKNENGTCEGTRVCEMQGLTDCDAVAPSVEICDDIDNDCDGYVDDGCDDDKDGFCDKAMTTIGTPVVCGNGGGDCNDADSGSYPGKTEVCDQKDNNCDGVIDDGICDDGDPCTDNICDPATNNCSFPYNQAPCNDSNECTENDSCNLGVCKGSQKNCDDNNPCTDNLCNPLLPGGCNWPNNSSMCTDEGNPCTLDICENGTCQHKPTTGIPCNDQNPCTDKDSCVSGTCVPGQPVVCNDDNICTKDECDPTKGCQYKVMQGTPCEYDVANLGICLLPGSCGADGCTPQPNCNTCTPPCSLCVCCTGFSFCLIK